MTFPIRLIGHILSVVRGESLKQIPACYIIGDVNIDYVTDLAHVFVGSEPNPCFQNAIASSVGGNAVFFAEAACEAEFAKVTVLCSVGDDLAGARVLKYLKTLGIYVERSHSLRPTGQVIIIYQPNDQRIMVADRGANRDFRGAVEIDWQGVQASDLLYISGYMLLEAEQCVAVHEMAAKFRASKAKILVDIVPHDIWQTYSWQDYVKLCSGADYVAVELSTITAFHQKYSETLQPMTAIELLLEDFEFCLLRLNAMSDFLIADQTRHRQFTIPYRRVTASLRFTDRVIAHVLQHYLADPNSLFESDQWIAQASQAVGG